MVAKSKLGDREVFFCTTDNAWKYCDNNQKVEYVLAAEYYCPGEMLTLITELSPGDLEQIAEIVGVDDLTENIEPEHPFKIKMITKEEMREASIKGCEYDGHSRANAERVADGLPPLEELDEDD